MILGNKAGNDVNMERCYDEEWPSRCKCFGNANIGGITFGQHMHGEVTAACKAKTIRPNTMHKEFAQCA